MIAGGYIHLYRAIMDHPIWKQMPPERLKVWLTILLRVNFAPSTAWDFHERKEVEIPVGSMLTSREDLVRFSGCTIKQVRLALDWLKSSDMITLKAWSRGTLISVVNWETYQQQGPDKGRKRAAQGPDKGGSRANQGPTKGQPRATSEEYKKGIQEKTEEGENVSGTPAPPVPITSHRSAPVSRFTAAQDPDWEKFRSAGEEYGWRFSEVEWSESYTFGWEPLDFPAKLKAVSHLRALIVAGDPGLVRAHPKNYLAKGMYERSVGMPASTNSGGNGGGIADTIQRAKELAAKRAAHAGN